MKKNRNLVLQKTNYDETKINHYSDYDRSDCLYHSQQSVSTTRYFNRKSRQTTQLQAGRQLSWSVRKNSQTLHSERYHHRILSRQHLAYL